jgi:hypothetical protein
MLRGSRSLPGGDVKTIRVNDRQVPIARSSTIGGPPRIRWGAGVRLGRDGDAV